MLISISVYVCINGDRENDTGQCLESFLSSSVAHLNRLSSSATFKRRFFFQRTSEMNRFTIIAYDAYA